MCQHGVCALVASFPRLKKCNPLEVRLGGGGCGEKKAVFGNFSLYCEELFPAPE